MVTEEHGLIVVDLVRIDQTFVRNDQRSIRICLTKEATFVTFVTGHSHLTNPQQDCIGITIDANFDHGLCMTTRFTFAPQLASAAAKVNCPARS